MEHAQLLRTLQGELEQGLAVCGRPAEPEAIVMGFNYLKSIMAFVKQTDISESMALSIAVDLEDTLIEKAVFTSLEDDPEALQRVFGRLGVDVRIITGASKRPGSNITSTKSSKHNEAAR